MTASCFQLTVPLVDDNSTYADQLRAYLESQEDVEYLFKVLANFLGEDLFLIALIMQFHALSEIWTSQKVVAMVTIVCPLEMFF